MELSVIFPGRFDGVFLFPFTFFVRRRKKKSSSIYTPDASADWTLSVVYLSTLKNRDALSLVYTKTYTILLTTAPAALVLAQSGLPYLFTVVALPLPDPTVAVHVESASALIRLTLLL